jgi:methylglutamate dehydrogenase subunit D
VSETSVKAMADKISERTDLTLVQVAVRRGQASGLSAAVEASFGVGLPMAPRIVQANDCMIAWSGPEHWLFLSTAGSGQAFCDDLATRFRGLASAVDVSDSRTVYALAAARPPEGLARQIGFDFSDAAFKPGDVAITTAAHLGFIVWRLPDGSGYAFACPRTYSRDFIDWLQKAC